MSDQAFSVRVKKFLSNPLLNRKQFSLDVVHPGRGNVSKKDLRDKIAQMYKVKDAETIILFGFKTAFGGGRSTGFGLIYDDKEAVKKFELKYRQVRFGLATAVTRSGRRGRKELKNRQKKVRGKEKGKVTGGKKK
eukprot:GDKI01021021.1.p2 GENE.GDKI01021021.1~~GDKI01021021.1.p2  ORF type:complete len:145 (+),score=59.18 GDKI01021021.1:31-435(+)